ncbi:MAG: SUMF1/EgtB/PvdO family nonheme iron enzyme [Planctomycetia bacterium]|nr:SUMF1/EgtB/PvdO family nonheme iron enzyme [Planctomycetia bacterium]
MKKKLLLILALTGTILIGSTSLHAQRKQQTTGRSQSESTQRTSNNRRGQPNSPQKPEFVTEDGQIDLNKLPDDFSDEMRKQWTQADKDGDGFLNEKERQSVFGSMFGGPNGPDNNRLMKIVRESTNDENQIDLSKFNEAFAQTLAEADLNQDDLLNQDELEAISGLGRRPEMNPNEPPRDQFGGPIGERRPGMFQRPDFMTEDGQIDLSKIPENIPEEMREQWLQADKDGDGFLNQEERQTLFGNRGGFPGGSMFQRPDFMTEDGQIDLSKIPENIPEEMREQWLQADKDGDGFLNQEEQRAQWEQMRLQRPEFNGQQDNRQRNRNNRQSDQMNSDRRNPNQRNREMSERMTPPGERPEGTRPEMGRGMNGMVMLRLVSTTIREKTADKESLEISELKKDVEEKLNEADLNEDKLLNENELQKLNESLPAMQRPETQPNRRPGTPPNRRPGNSQQQRENNLPFELETQTNPEDVPNDSFAFIPKNTKFKFSFDISNKEKGEAVAIQNDYCLAKFPVTNAEYKKFIDATQRTKFPKYWKDETFPKGKENHPVLWISIQDAQDYCQWLESINSDWEFRLPTEAEWENAAAGPKKWKYPWGNNEKSTYRSKSFELNTLYNYNAVVANQFLSQQDQITVKYSNSDDEIDIDSLLSINSRGVVSGWKNKDKTGFIFTDLFNELVNSGGFTTPVDQYPDGMSYYGCFDMAGNSFDWTSTKIEAQNGAEKGQMVHAIRGGSWYSVGKSCQTTFRGEGRNPQNGYATVGFRVVAVKKE